MQKQSETPRILVVEDDLLVAEDLAGVLCDLGYEVPGIFDSGEEAVKQSGILKPDMILMDIRLREKMDGIEAADTIFKKYRIPSVFLTGYADEATLKRVTDFGPFGYVLKPYQERELKAAIDIALKRNRTEKALERSKFDFQDIVEKMQDGIMILGFNGELRFINSSAQILLGSPFDSAVLHLMSEIAKKDSSDKVFDLEQNNKILEVKALRYQWEGELVYLAVLRDITERKKAQQKVELAEKNTRRLIDQNMDAMVVMDKEGVVLFANPSALKIFGRTREELIGQQFGYPFSLQQASEIQILRKEGNIAIAEMKMVETDWQNKICYLASIRDITEQKRLTEQLFQAQKMDEIGNLAGGVAHDFNNLLTVIKGYSEFMLDRCGEDEKMTGYADGILGAANRAASLTNQLLAFSRRKVVAPKVFCLNVLIQDMEKMLGRLITEDIQLITKLKQGLASIKVDPGQMEQVLLNLVVNARDAMPEGGEICVETTTAVGPVKGGEKNESVPKGNYIVLKVRDNGAGIPEKVRKHIFEPFFTTKKEGKGTGLGLSTCHSIVKEAHGYVTIDSQEGKGTCFNIYIPQSHEKKELLISERKDKELPRGNETILLVEDDTDLRELVVSILQGQGYHVLIAKDGLEGLHVSQKAKQPVHLLVTDVVMPAMNGRELAERIKRIYPDIKMLFMSGYMDDTVVKRGILEQKVNFIQKPFGPKALVFTIRKVLDSDRRGQI